MKFARIGAAIAAALFSLAPISAYAQSVLASQTVTFENYTALKAVPFARFTTYKPTLIVRGLRGGEFEVTTDNKSSLVSADPGECVFIPSPQDATGASGGYIRRAYVEEPGVVYSNWCGALMDAVPGTSDGTDDTTALNNLITGINAGVFTEWRHPGMSRISGTAALTTIAADNWSLRGTSFNAGFYKTASATSGAFLVFGNKSTFKGIRVAVSDLYFVVNQPDQDTATISENDYTIEIDYCNSCAFERIRGKDTGAVLKYIKGGLTRLVDWNFEPEMGANAAAVVDLYDLAVVTFENWDISNADVDADADADGAMIRMSTTPTGGAGPVTGGSLDTIRFVNFGAQLFDSNTGAGSNTACTTLCGKPIGLLIDRVDDGGATSNSSVTNIIWINSYIDHTTVAAVKDQSAAGSDSDSRWIIFDQYRFATDAGDGFVIDHSTTAGQDRTDFMIGSGKVIIQDDSQAVLITGTQDYRNSWINGLNVSNRVATAKTKAVSIDAEGWRVGQVYIDEDGSGADPTPFTTGVVIESAGLTDTFVYGPITCGVFGCSTDLSASASQDLTGGSGGAPDFGSPTQKTIASGTIALSGETFITVNAESGTVDTLSTITGASQGDTLLVQVAAGDTITFENNNGATGSFWMGEDVVLDSAVDKLFFVFNGTKWNAIGKNYNFSDPNVPTHGTVEVVITDGTNTVSTGANADYTIEDGYLTLRFPGSSLAGVNNTSALSGDIWIDLSSLGVSFVGNHGVGLAQVAQGGPDGLILGRAMNATDDIWLYRVQATAGATRFSSSNLTASNLYLTGSFRARIAE